MYNIHANRLESFGDAATLFLCQTLIIIEKLTFMTNDRAMIESIADRSLIVRIQILRVFFFLFRRSESSCSYQKSKNVKYDAELKKKNIGQPHTKDNA